MTCLIYLNHWVTKVIIYRYLKKIKINKYLNLKCLKRDVFFPVPNLFFFSFSLTIFNHWHLPLCFSRQRTRSHLWIITFFSLLPTLIHQQVLFAIYKISENHPPVLNAATTRVPVSISLCQDYINSFPAGISVPTFLSLPLPSIHSSHINQNDLSKALLPDMVAPSYTFFK